MANVEEACFLTGPFVGLADTEVGVLHWHRVAGEGDHFRAMLDVEIIKTGTSEGRVRGCRRCMPTGRVERSYSMRPLQRISMTAGFGGGNSAR